MKWIVCTVYDHATEIHGRPVFVRARGEALRSFMDEAQNKESAIGQHPADYALYALGTFDDGQGTFECLTVPELLMRGKDVNNATE